MSESKLITVLVHCELRICTLSPAPSQFGYVIDHASFFDQYFATVQDAVYAINDLLDRG